MPRSRNKHSHVKVYRPNGMRYSEGKSSDMHQAIQEAWDAFYEEFGEGVQRRHLVIEIVGGLSGYHARLMEVLD